MPKAFFLTRGIGIHKEQLTAFELALRDADIEQQNLVTVSSILPPGCVEREKDAGVATLHPGEITFAVMARTETNEPGHRINASIGVARPSDASMYGYISERHGYGKDELVSMGQEPPVWLSGTSSLKWRQPEALPVARSTSVHRIGGSRGVSLRPRGLLRKAK
jgi:pyruvoyl-dependent arginine decarboxylase